MDSRIRQRVEEFSSDRSSGSAELAWQALDILQQAKSFEEDFREIGNYLMQGQPSMAAVLNIVHRALERKGESLDGIAEEIEKSQRKAIAAAVRRLEGYSRIAAYSRSSTVEETLLRLGETNPRLQVTLSESRPGNEGITLAGKLAEAGVRVFLCVDALLPELLKECEALVIGADAVIDDRFANKIGSAMMCRAAKSAGIPVFVIAASEKFLPPEALKYYHIEEQPPQAVIDPVPENVRVVNRLFEWVDRALVTEVITD